MDVEEADKERKKEEEKKEKEKKTNMDMEIGVGVSTSIADAHAEDMDRGNADGKKAAAEVEAELQFEANLEHMSVTFENDLFIQVRGKTLFLSAGGSIQAAHVRLRYMCTVASAYLRPCVYLVICP